ncbi:MAG: hypothetical protein NTV24_02155 [Candidatus Woesebacteria bacterium]|nr:hypothetical protein [Candidatus Woesebacteria bacterium]
MIITKINCLWTTRLLTYLVLRIMNYGVRKPGDINQKDKLCLNIWLDESALSWDRKDRNIYSAHEIAQVVPIVDKENICQRFLQKNRWILDYWPNAVRIEPINNNLYSKTHTLFVNVVEKLAFRLQYLYMKPKITREIVTIHKAIFHPVSWGQVVLKRLSV